MSAERAGRAGVGAAVALFLLLTVPFAGKAHGPDDPLYLAAARHVLANPLDPLGAASFWHERPTTLFSDLYNPPLVAYLLALPVLLDGGSEASAQLLMILLGALTLVVAARAGRALDVAPRWTLLIAVSPALAASSVSALSDLPFLLLTLLAWTAALAGHGATGGLWTGLSALTKYVGLLNAPLALLALRGRPRRAQATLALGFAVIFGGWCLWNVLQHGAAHVGAAGRFGRLALGHHAQLVASFVAALGLAGLPAALALLRWTRGLAAAALAAGLVGGVVLPAGTPQTALLAACAVASGTVLLVSAGRASRACPFAAAAFWTYAAYTMVFPYFGAARYLLPLLPPLVWLLVRGGLIDERASPGRAAAALGLGALLTVAVLRADAGWSGAWRTAAGRLPPATGRAFQTGHWGFQHYAGLRGYGPLDPRQALTAGDRVALPADVHGSGPSPAQRAVLVRDGEIRVPSPWLRLMDRRVGAGFWSSAWGLLPFAVRPGAQEIVTLGTVPSWLTALDAVPLGAVTLDVGSPEARHVLLDGWSGDESFDEGGVRRRFVWMEGAESALRVAIPRGARRLVLRAFPRSEAVGPLEVSLEPFARATVLLAAGWREYVAPIEGGATGGPTTVVLRPQGFHRPGALDRERRPLSVAVDLLAFGDETGAANTGVWPMAGESGPAVFAAGDVALRAGRARLRVRTAKASLVWTKDDGAALPLWTATADCAGDGGCLADVETPAGPGRLVLRTSRATLLEPMDVARLTSRASGPDNQAWKP